MQPLPRIALNAVALEASLYGGTAAPAELLLGEREISALSVSYEYFGSLKPGELHREIALQLQLHIHHADDHQRQAEAHRLLVEALKAGAALAAAGKLTSEMLASMGRCRTTQLAADRSGDATHPQSWRAPHAAKGQPVHRACRNLAAFLRWADREFQRLGRRDRQLMLSSAICDPAPKSLEELVQRVLDVTGSAMQERFRSLPVVSGYYMRDRHDMAPSEMQFTDRDVFEGVADFVMALFGRKSTRILQREEHHRQIAAMTPTLASALAAVQCARTRHERDDVLERALIALKSQEPKRPDK